MSKNISEIPYTSVTNAMQSNSTRGSNSLNTYHRTIRGFSDNVLIEYNESNKSTYNNFNILDPSKDIEYLSNNKNIIITL